MIRSMICLTLFVAHASAAEPMNDPATQSIRSHDSVAAVAYLSRNPRSINRQNKLGMTPIMVAVSEKHIDSVTRILNLKPDLSIRGFENKNALEISMEEPVPEIVEALLLAGAQVNDRNPESGSTILHMAVRTQNLEIIRLLLKYKADVNIKNKKGESPLSMAAARQANKAYELLLGSLHPAK